jgi:hypothetical protein
MKATDQQKQQAREWIRAGGKSTAGVKPVSLAKAFGWTEKLAVAVLADLRAAQPVELTSEHRLRTENEDLRRKLRESLESRVLNEKYESFIGSIAAKPVHPPQWVREAKMGKPRQGTPLAHLSDAHFDENVNPAEIDFSNAYGREIATKRLRMFGDNTIELCDDYLKGIDYPGIVLAVSGDMFSGNIHDELRETNEDSLCGSLVYWLGPMAATVRMFAEHFGKVYIPWVVGNHPRGTPKPRAKGAVRDNFDWLLGQLLAREFSGDKRVEFNISDAFDCHFSIYGTRYLQTHGDQFKGGSGIAAELSPMMIGDARKRKKQQALRTPYDVMICGHWHRRLALPQIKVNGSIKGFDEYAYRCNFEWQPAVQSFWITDPRHGITIEAPIHVKAKSEGWENEAGVRRPSFAAA